MIRMRYVDQSEVLPIFIRTCMCLANISINKNSLKILGLIYLWLILSLIYIVLIYFVFHPSYLRYIFLFKYFIFGSSYILFISFWFILSLVYILL